MNRKKKINSILKKRLKKINAKAAPTNKEKYISKAERAKLEVQESEENITDSTISKDNE